LWTSVPDELLFRERELRKPVLPQLPDLLVASALRALALLQPWNNQLTAVIKCRYYYIAYFSSSDSSLTV
jgi:hypothetical protein